MPEETDMLLEGLSAYIQRIVDDSTRDLRERVRALEAQIAAIINPKDLPQQMSLADVERTYLVSRTFLHRLIRSGELPATRIVRHGSLYYLVDRDVAANAMAKHGATPKGE